MTRAAYEQLIVLLTHAIEDTPPDEQIQRLGKGLTKALKRRLQWMQAAEPVQARSGTPRHSGLASVNASLASAGEDHSGETSRQERADRHR